VVKVLMRCIEDMSEARAEEIMATADAFGKAMVVICAQEKAEDYCEKLRANGLTSSIESAE
jgi:ATP-dependent Clp protease adaptor protein ClpS